MNLSQLSQRLVDTLALTTAPVALAFVDEAPAGVAHLGRSTPSGCTFWKLASLGETFYTVPEDHHGCPIGAHTHGLQLSGEPQQMLGTMIGMMVKLRYLREEEVPSIPTLKGGFKVAVYAPLASSPVDPDVVILRGNPRQLMLATESARAAGLEGNHPMRERPTCAMVAEVMESGRGQPSFSCIGNRVYTALSDDEFYFAIPGSKIEEFANQAEALATANRELENFHRSRVPAAT